MFVSITSKQLDHGNGNDVFPAYILGVHRAGQPRMYATPRDTGMMVLTSQDENMDLHYFSLRWVSVDLTVLWAPK